MVNADDYGLIDRGFTSQKGGWYNGDFNYDDVVNADDYGMIDRAFIGQTGRLSFRDSVPSAVPEPGTVFCFTGIAAGAMVRRLRRR